MFTLKILVTYSTRTGNTKKVAKAIHDEINKDKVIINMEDLSDLDGYDLIFFGCPIETFGPSKKVKEFLKEHTSKKNIALFITHGSPELSDYLLPWIEESKNCLDETANLLGVFTCQGEVAQFVMDHMSKSDDPNLQYFAKESPKSKGQPDKSRISKAKEFAREILSKSI